MTKLLFQNMIFYSKTLFIFPDRSDYDALILFALCFMGQMVIINSK